MQCPRGLEHGRDPGDSGRALRVRVEAGAVRSTDHRHATRLPRARRLRRNARQRRLSATSDDRAEQTPCSPPGGRRGCSRCTRARAIGRISPICRPPRRYADAARPASATPGRWAASWCAARPATTSSPSSIPAPGEPVIDKPGKGAFWATDLHAILQHRGIKQLVVTGVTTEVCVNTTVREANDRGYDCLVLEDCVGSYFPEFQAMGLKMIKAQGGIFGWVAKSEAVIEALAA